jgi:hypothetical protein
MVPVSMVSWFLPELSERELTATSVCEIPSDELLRDASLLYKAAYDLMKTESAPIKSSTVNEMMQVSRFLLLSHFPLSRSHASRRGCATPYTPKSAPSHVPS